MKQSKVTLKPKNSNQVKIINAFLLILLALLIIPPIYQKFQVNKQQENQNVIKSVDKNNVTFDKNGADIPQLVDKVSESVVSIVASSQFQNFFGQNYNQSGAGTGVIVSKDGYILTNKHVINNATQVQIITNDGEIYTNAKLIYKDPLNDLAYIKVNEPKNFKPLEIGESKTLKVGQSVLAIGNSLGEFHNTVTNGIVSGLNRSIQAQDGNNVSSLTDMIQTNAAINPGNSGGPLVNAAGQIIGINTAISQGANNIGFAIPIGAAKGVLRQLGSKSDDEIGRAYLGVYYSNINPAIAKEKKLSVKAGALIDEKKGVLEDGPADKAGIKKGDIITQINDDLIGKKGSLNSLISEYMPGEEVTLKVLRDKKTKNIKVTLKKQEE